jgi:hypothetical protein
MATNSDTINKKQRIAMIADVCNGSVPESVVAHLSQEKNINIVPHHLLGRDCSVEEIFLQMQDDYPVVIAAIGVSIGGHSEYEGRIHTLLEAWWRTTAKPVMLLLSHEPAETQKFVESWPTWEKVPPELRRAIL